MNRQSRCLRLGAGLILLAVALRLVSNGIGGKVMAFFGKPETVQYLLYLQSGRVLRPAEQETTAPTQPAVTETAETASSEPEVAALPVFSGEDSALVDIRYGSSYSPDIGALLCSALSWDLTQKGPAVLICHSHATESYTKTAQETYTESSAYRTLDTNYNMVSIGDHLARLLRQQGIGVIHDRSLHDEPSYSGAYGSSRKSVQAYLEQYPSIQLVIDLHRDALSLDSEQQLSTHALVGDKASAQLMMVVGTDGSGLNHPNWQENLALALKLHVALEKAYPGIMRPISFRSQRFNQDLSGGAVLIEVGAAGDTHAEALTATEALAEAIVSLARGTAGKEELPS